MSKSVLPVHMNFRFKYHCFIGYSKLSKFSLNKSQFFSKQKLLINFIFYPSLVFTGKFLICLLVLRLVLPPQNRKYKWVISSGLAQISEFSFVLGSRARHLKIITREVSCFAMFL